MNDLGCRRISKSEESEILKAMNYKETAFKFNGSEFSSLAEIYKFAKKQKILKGDITNSFGVWGCVSNLVSLTKKQFTDKFGYYN